jgi:hypothetical protein
MASMLALERPTNKLPQSAPGGRAHPPAAGPKPPEEILIHLEELAKNRVDRPRHAQVRGEILLWAHAQDSVQSGLCGVISGCVRTADFPAG